MRRFTATLVAALALASPATPAAHAGTLSSTPDQATPSGVCDVAPWWLTCSKS